MLSPHNDDDELTYLDTHVHIFVQIFFLILVSEKVYKKAKWEAATLDHSLPPSGSPDDPLGPVRCDPVAPRSYVSLGMSFSKGKEVSRQRGK